MKLKFKVLTCQNYSNFKIATLELLRYSEKIIREKIEYISHNFTN